MRHHNLPRNSNLSSGHVPNINAANNNYNNRSGHGQIIANIENNPSNYERDWALDDSSQSSFKPCPQGSGSMTPLPFHDSAHTMYEPGQLRSSGHSSTNGSGPDLNQIPNTTLHASSSVNLSTNKTGNDLNLFKVNAQHTHYPNSSVFLENSDILDDKDYPKLYHRHSTIIMAPDSVNCDIERDVSRRYSDTKLLQANIDDNESTNSGSSNYHNSDINAIPIFNVANVLGASIPTTLATSHVDTFTVPQVTDIIFENNSTFDPLELNIQEMLEVDMSISRPALSNPRYSMTNVAINDDKYSASGKIHANNSTETYINNNENRNYFKSMPNLSASSENLLQK